MLCDNPTRTCRHCGHTGPLANFVKNAQSKFGRDRVCKRCETKRALRWNNRNAKKKQAAYVRRTYGIPHEEYIALSKLPCGICGKRDDPHIDHDHVTGQIRGTLCHCCNVTLGLMKDDPARLRAAAAYLERARD